MSFLQNSTIANNLSWTQRDLTQGDVTTLDNGQFNFNQTFATGTGISQLDSVFYTSGTISGGQSIQVDLFNLNRTLFGATLTTNFSGGKIKILNIENLSSSGRFNLLNTGSNTVAFNILGSGITINSQTYYSMINQTGYPVSSTQRYFYLSCPEVSGTIGYEMALLGNKP